MRRSSRGGLSSEIAKIEVTGCVVGVREAYAAARDEGLVPSDPALRSVVENLLVTVDEMASLRHDYPRPDTSSREEWEEALERRPGPPSCLTPRWYPLFQHPQQHALWNSTARFRVLPCGRRSGKTERAKRFLVYKALDFTAHPDGRFYAAAPTHEQSKKIFWNHLKAMVPKRYLVGTPRESDLIISLYNGAKIQVVGLDKPERVEGDPIDGIVIDEYGNCKPTVWGKHLRPALMTIARPGWAWLLGVPRGARHYRKQYDSAVAGRRDWFATIWPSSDILSPWDIEEAKDELDPLTFASEFEGSFETTANRIYYQFGVEHNCERLAYDPTRPLIFCFDFNVAPGVAVVVQEQEYKGKRTNVADVVIACIGEVHIPQSSNTPRVCRKLLADWGHHEGAVRCYGDPAGGNRSTTQLRGSDWDLIREILGGHFHGRFGIRVDKAHPAVISRTSSLNSVLMASSGKVRMLIDPVKCPNLVIDLQDVVPLKGTMEIDKSNLEITHLTDALSYFTEKEYPTKKRTVSRAELY